MDQLINLYGELVIAYIGFITPMAGVLFSSFEDGIAYVREQYEIERKNIQDNLVEQNRKLVEEQAKGAKIDQDLLTAMQRNLAEMLQTEEKTKKKLNLLQPKKQISKLILLLGLTFILILISHILPQNQSVQIFKQSIQVPWQLIALMTSLIPFTLSNIILWNILGILVEVRSAINKKNLVAHNEEYSSIMSHLQIISEAPYIKDVYPIIDGTLISDDTSQINLKREVKKSLTIFIKNKEKKKIAKNVELGFIFPKEFIVEKNSDCTIYNDESNNEPKQIIRFNHDKIHTKTNMEEKPLVITPLKEGSHKITIFMKAENMEAKYYEVTFLVTA